VSLILDKHALDLISHSADQTRRLGAYLGELLRAGDVVCLRGELGVGKTCLVQGIARGMHITGPVTSPSFTLVNEYESTALGLRVYHIDLYRLADALTDALAIGLEEYLYGDGVCIIEWSERAWEAMPAERLTIEMRYINYHKRGILVQAAGDRPDRLLIDFRELVFGQSDRSHIEHE
jgi:tRNA threonylcarbamoyladenosine biosynthesis protein TsaE